MGGSSQQLLRRLKLLYHHGFLERPRAQIDYYHRGGSQLMVYGLGSRGVASLKQELGAAFQDRSWGGDDRGAGRMFLQHELLVADVMVAIELACRERGIRLFTEDRLQSGIRRFRWKVKVRGGGRLSVIPDRVFALEFPDQKGNRACFFLEADRGTMPVMRKNLSQTSFYRKLLAYEATWSQAIHRSRFGFHRFRVLTITTNSERVKHLIDACRTLESGRGLFLFTDISSLRHPDFLSLPWQTTRPGITATLFD